MMGEGHDREKPVGYKNPPRNRQFVPGQSGNPRGRPRKDHPREEAVDALAILDKPMAVRKDGQQAQMPPYQVSLLQQVKKALAGDQPALHYLLDLFVQHGVFHEQRGEESAGGALDLPFSMPWSMASELAYRHGMAPWTPAQIAAVRADYLADRDARQKAIDDAIGYPEL